jgi:hypothetical protein
MGQVEQNQKDKTTRKGLPGQDCQDRTARTGRPGQDCQDRTARTGLPGQDCQDRTARTGLPVQDSQDRTAWKRTVRIARTGKDNTGFLFPLRQPIKKQMPLFSVF